MANEIRAFEFTIPAGTTKSAPVKKNLSMPPREVVEIDVKIPSGLAGLCGFQIGASGVPIVPLNEGEWITGDDDLLSWPLSATINSGAWQIYGYNLGDFPHTIYIRFQVDVLTANPNRPTFISGSSLSS